MDLQLKELGFNEKCLVYLKENELIWCPDEPCCNSQFLSSSISISLWQQVIDWLDIEYNILIMIKYLDINGTLQPIRIK